MIENNTYDQYLKKLPKFNLLRLNHDVLELIISFIDTSSRLNLLYSMNHLTSIPLAMRKVIYIDYIASLICNQIKCMINDCLYFIPQECTLDDGIYVFITADWSVFSNRAAIILATSGWSEQAPYMSQHIFESGVYEALYNSRCNNTYQMRLTAHVAMFYGEHLLLPIHVCPCITRLVDLIPTKFAILQK